MIRSSLLLALLVTACSGGDDPKTVADAEPCAMQLEWGRRVNGVFTPFRDGDQAEITLGFQGFRFIDSVARLRSVRGKEATFKLQATLDGRESMVQDAGAFTAKQQADGALYVESLQLFFNDVPMPELIGQNASIVVNATAAGCAATAAARVSLVRGGCMNSSGEIVSCVAG